MVLSFAPREQIANVIVTQTFPKAERPTFRSVTLTGGRCENLVKAGAQSGIDYLFKRLLEFGGALPSSRGDVWIERQGGAH